MSAVALAGPVLGSDDARDARLWAWSFAAVVALHIGLGAYLLVRAPSDVPGEALPAVLIDMAPPASAPSDPQANPRVSEHVPEAAAPMPVPDPVPDVPDAVVAPPPTPPLSVPALPDLVSSAPPQATALAEVTTPSPALDIPLPPIPAPAVVPPDPAVVVPPPPASKEALPVPAPPVPVVPAAPKPAPPRKAPEKKVVEAPRPVQATRRADRVTPRQAPAEASGAQTTASLPAASAGASAASAASWRSRLVAHLQSNLRYPASGTNGGAAFVSFSMNRQGRVTAANLARSAGSSDLDAAALALFRGSLPPPPPDVAGASFSFTIPIRFNRR